MSPRYYLITGILVVVLTMVISAWQEKRTPREVFGVLCRVVLSIALVVGALLGFARLLAVLGIAESGFFL
ncbi:MAG: hypothetical protein COV67_04520 [Nitrospinae bacterium CG11_big_fil_rev_8_21_14_0_20_56_8]|nr:MAG: hypothetical protein COV67_04520 [Nitrospinae bacterium CG11_big_fil_rev_8_21_14_0_20_56_8]